MVLHISFSSALAFTLTTLFNVLIEINSKNYYIMENVELRMRSTQSTTSSSALTPPSIDLSDQIILEGPPGEYRCEGLLITTYIALTAAHCLVGISPRLLRVSGQGFKNQEIYNVILHENFNPTTHDHDIALVIVPDATQTINESYIVPPNGTVFPENKEAFISKLGSLSRPVSLVPFEDCKANTEDPVNTWQFCVEASSTRSHEGIEGILRCDETGLGRIHPCGIFSWYKGIIQGNVSNFTIFTRFSSYHDWILSTIAGRQNGTTTDPISPIEITMTVCSYKEFQCNKTKECITLYALCDGTYQCGSSDTSDEENCREVDGCHKGEFPCQRGNKCIRAHQKCDGKFDCTDESDEMNCSWPTCHPSERFCANTSKCLSPNKLCDGTKDCEDGSDEENCVFNKYACSKPGMDTFKCFDKYDGCVSWELKCDGVAHCKNGSDEDESHCGINWNGWFGVIMNTVIGLAAAILTSLFITLIVICFKYRRQRAVLSAMEIRLFEKGDETQLKANQYAHENAQFIPYNRDFEIKWKDMEIFEEEKLGGGAFGVVYKGKMASENPSTIAVKTVKPKVDKTFLLALLSELKVMIHLGKHENIVELFGACTQYLKEGRVYVLIEYCPGGSLASHIRELASRKTNDCEGDGYVNTGAFMENETLRAKMVQRKELVHWAIQIVRGMRHLQSRKVIHGDLATRNVLLSSNGQVKITDFGLSRQLLNYDNYVKKTKGLLPWRWLAIETLKSMVFSHKSDVWAFGVTLWEIFSFGLVPYAGTTWTLDFVSQLEQNQRLPKPKYANNEIYEIMTRCWEPEPKDRPDFDELEEIFQNFLQ